MYKDVGIKQRRPPWRRRGKAERTSGAQWREHREIFRQRSLRLKLGAKNSFCPLPGGPGWTWGGLFGSVPATFGLSGRIAPSVSGQWSWRRCSCNWRRYLRQAFRQREIRLMDTLFSGPFRLKIIPRTSLLVLQSQINSSRQYTTFAMSARGWWAYD